MDVLMLRSRRFRTRGRCAVFKGVTGAHPVLQETIGAHARSTPCPPAAATERSNAVGVLLRRRRNGGIAAGSSGGRERNVPRTKSRAKGEASCRTGTPGVRPRSEERSVGKSVSDRVTPGGRRIFKKKQ